MKGMINLALFEPDDDTKMIGLLIAQFLRNLDYGVDLNSFDKFKRIFIWSWQRGYDRVWVLGKQELKNGNISYFHKNGPKETWLIEELLNDDDRGVNVKALRKLAKNRSRKAKRARKLKNKGR